MIKQANRLVLFIFLCIFLASAGWGAVSAETRLNRAPTTIYTVNATDDVINGGCTTSHCNLREAITIANAFSGTDTIRFAFTSPTTIRPVTQLPTITDPVRIDGITGTGSTCPTSASTPANLKITIDGNNTSSVGLLLNEGANGSTIEGLNIVRFGGDGIYLSLDSLANVIVCNHIGLPNADLGGYANGGGGNNNYGILAGGAFHQIGGNDHADRNVIVGKRGISLIGDGNHLVVNNYIGTTRDGALGLGTADDINGIYITSDGNQVGNATIGNVIGGYRHGISLGGINTYPGNSIFNNKIGTNRTDSNPIPNGTGIKVQNADDSTIGGAAGLGNIIANSTYRGVWLIGPNDSVISTNTIRNNAEGVVSGTTNGSSLRNEYTANLIYDNGGNGLRIEDEDEVTIIGNTIYDNGGHGLYFAETDGGSVTLNTIYGNSGDGIRIGRYADSNKIRMNSIYDNGGLGIDLANLNPPLDAGGISYNDTDDNDAGGNNQQNFPVLLSAELNGQLSGSFQRDTSNTFGYLIDAYLNDNCDDQTFGGVPHGEGKTWIDSFTIGIGITQGTFTWTQPLSTLVPGKFLTLTATDFENNTSEFGSCIAITAPPFVVNSNINGADTNPGDGVCTTSSNVCTLPAAIAEVNALGALANGEQYKIEFDLNNPINSINASDPLVIRVPVVIDGSDNNGASCGNINNPPSLNIHLLGILLTPGENIMQLADGSDGSVIRGLAFVGGPADGLRVNSNNNTIVCSLFGIQVNGNISGNGDDGIHIAGGNDTRIGVLSNSGDRNIFAGNAGAGVQITDGSLRTAVRGNLIGTTLDGNGALANGYGIDVAGGSNNTEIGGVLGQHVNVIAANTIDGVLIRDSATVTVTNNVIGQFKDGAAGGNGRDNIRVSQTPDVLIEDNIIRASGDYGVYVLDSAETIIRQNNIRESDSSGIRLTRTSNATIGGNNASDSNIIFHSGGSGIYLQTLVSGTTIHSNTIGTSSANGSTYDGIHINDSVTNSDIAFNTIAGHGRDGIRVDASSIGNNFSANSIRDNIGLGINLNEDTVTPNDKDSNFDADIGANGLTNFPTLLSAYASSGDIRVKLSAKPSTSYRIELFTNDVCDGENGEGATYFAQQQVTTSAPGFASITISTLGDFDDGDVLTATATDLSGDGTSEFSVCLTANEVPTAVAFSAQQSEINEQSGTVVYGLLALIMLTIVGADFGRKSHIDSGT